MAQPYVGEIRMFAGNFAPAGWFFCAGQLLPISEYETLFNLIGTTYGGDGQETFGLPNMLGRVPIHQGNGYVIGEMAGVDSVTLTTSEMPYHNHALLASNAPAIAPSPKGSLLAHTTAMTPYGSGNPGATLGPQALVLTGGSQPHDNRQPYLCVSFIISLFGIYPQPS
jgi:microcystin-dependent protein